MAISSIYISATSFSVAGDYTDVFSVGRMVRSWNGVDGYSYGSVQSRTFSSPNTTVVLNTVDGTLTSNLLNTLVGIADVTTGSLPDHDHSDHGHGGDIERFTLTDGTKAFTGTVAGITPTTTFDLTTKGYVDTVVSTLENTGQSGQYDILNGVDNFTVTLPTALTNTNYDVVGMIINTGDANPAKYGYIITNTTTTNFRVDMSDITDSANYKFNWRLGNAITVISGGEYATEIYVDTQDAALQINIDGKADLVHAHTESDITDLRDYALSSELTATSGSLQEQIDSSISYEGWSFAVDGETKDQISSGDVLDFVGGDNIIITRSAEDQITISGGASMEIHGNEYHNPDFASTVELTTASGDIVSQIPSDFYSQSEVDAKDTVLDNKIATNSGIQAAHEADSTIHFTEASIDKYTQSETDALLNDKYDKVGGTISGDVTIQGDLTVSGTKFIANVEEVLIEDNLMVLNYGEPGAGVTAGEAGIEIDRGSETNYQFMFVEATDNFQIGISGSLQAVATREDSPTDTHVPYWNDSLTRFDTADSIAYSDIASESYVDTVSGVLQTNIDNKTSNHGEVPTVSGTYTGRTFTFTCDDVASVGAPLYIKDTGNLGLADSTISGTMPCSFLSVSTGTGSIECVNEGYICNTDWNWSKGKYVYITTSSGLSHDNPTASGNWIQPAGISVSAATIVVNIQPELLI